MRNAKNAMIPINKIICGDALEKLRELPDACVDMIFTDPPYGHNNNGELRPKT